jgi:hypothetical protein
VGAVAGQSYTAYISSVARKWQPKPEQQYCADCFGTAEIIECSDPLVCRECFDKRSVSATSPIAIPDADDDQIDEDEPAAVVDGESADF